MSNREHLLLHTSGMCLATGPEFAVRRFPLDVCRAGAPVALPLLQVVA